MVMRRVFINPKAITGLHRAAEELSRSTRISELRIAIKTVISAAPFFVGTTLMSRLRHQVTVVHKIGGHKIGGQVLQSHMASFG